MRGRRSVLVFTVAIASMVSGCARSPRDRLQGRWLGAGVENLPASQVGKATGWVKGTALEFRGSRATVTIPAESPRTGTFKVASVDGDRLAVSFLRDEGGRDEAVLRFVRDDTLHWSIGAGEIVLTRANR